MEVRCCCNPGKLLGYIPMEEPDTLGVYEVDSVVPGKKVKIEVAWLGGGWTADYLAVKSNDLPIEYYEQIKGWLPAEGAELINLLAE